MSAVGEKRPASEACPSTEEIKKRKQDDCEGVEGFFMSLVHEKVDSPRTAEEKILFCRREDKMVDVWKGLVEHNFLSVPVIQKTKNKYYGFVDLADIVTYVVKEFAHKSLGSVSDWWALCAESEDIQKVTVNDIMRTPLTRRNPFHPISTGYSLFSAAEALAREEHLHRVPVLNNHTDRKLINIITQSQMLDIFQKRMALLGEKANAPVVFKTSQEVLSVKESETAISAFEKIVQARVTGIAVVNDSGSIVGNVSVRDLKGIHTDGRVFWRLFQSVKDFMAHVHEEYQRVHGIPKELVSVTKAASVKDAVDLMVKNHLHRVYVVDDDKKPVGVVSIKDILRQIIDC